ncbi:MAG TPA: hypothetical protein VMM36_13855 [Opitutaceae bacterium]|nr:hypothetical protein [Opitutaceae bacterium]
MRASLLTVVLALSLVAGAPLHASMGGFTSTLSVDEQAACGVAVLTEAEREYLNELVAADVALARQGGTAAFTGTFSSRRSANARATAGIDRLSAEAVAELDRLVAALIATGPHQRYTPKRFTDSVTKVQDRLEIHGEISFTYGWGSGGRDFKGGSLTTVIFDKETGTTFAFSYGQYEGDLFNHYDGRFYDGRFHDSRYYGGPLSTAFERERMFSRTMGSVRR